MKDTSSQPQGSNAGPILILGLLLGFGFMGLVGVFGLIFVGYRAAQTREFERAEEMRAQAEREQAMRPVQVQPSPAKGPRPASGPRLASAELTDLSGEPVILPPAEPIIVNVFLERCADCMPAFEAYRDRGGLEDLAPVVNLSYQAASPDWLARYELNRRVVVDPGRIAVNPLGIRTFTTLVIDTSGRVLARLSPTQGDYEAQVKAALEQARGAALDGMQGGVPAGN